jgi:cobalt-zinc-cadmium efflux system protein
MTGSLALFADAGHMLTDVGGLALALFATRMAHRPSTPERSYGYYRAEILAALMNAVVLLGISAFILWEAYSRFRHPEPVAGGVMLAVAMVGLAVNVASMRLLGGGAGQSLNVKGAYLEVLSDLVSSVGVIVAAIGIWATGAYWLDPLISAGIGLFIVPRTLTLMREAVDILMEATPADISLAAVRQALARAEGVNDVHDLHVWVLTSGVNAVSAHLLRQADVPYSQVLSAARQEITGRFAIQHMTFQVEDECPDAGAVHP